MKQSKNDTEIKYTITDIQYNIDKYCTNLEEHRQRLRILGSEIGTESFSKNPVEYRNDVVIITERIIETNKVLEKSNELLSNLMMQRGK